MPSHAYGGRAFPKRAFQNRIDASNNAPNHWCIMLCRPVLHVDALLVRVSHVQVLYVHLLHVHRLHRPTIWSTRCPAPRLIRITPTLYRHTRPGVRVAGTSPSSRHRDAS